MTTALFDTPTRPAITPKVKAVIDAAAERLVAEFHPEQIWLFGSYAWGEPDEHSDLDFVVVVSQSDESPLKRAQRAQRCLHEFGMAKDVLVKTREEFDRFRDVAASLTHKITREGRLLHGARRTLADSGAASSLARAANEATAPSSRSRNEPKRDWIRLCLQKAKSELRAARLFAGEGDGPLDTTIFHCQHAAERAVKGYLAFADRPLRETDDVEQLVREAIAIEPMLTAIIADARIVAPYSTNYRYPSANDPMQPDRAEFDAALAAAQRIYDFVLSLLPAETHPT